MRRIPVVCPFCGIGCRFYIKVVDDTVVDVKAYKGESVNRGSLCPKGLTSTEYLTSPSRLRYPLKKTETGFKPITWKEALREITERLIEFKKKYGADVVGFVSSARCTNEENYVFQKLARLYGTNNIDNCSRLCHASSMVGLTRTLGLGVQSSPFEEILRTNVVLIWGCNPAETHPVLMKYVLKAREHGARIIVVDPRRTRTAQLADIHLQLHPGTDVALANSLMNVIINKRLYNTEFIRERTTGFNDLSIIVDEYPPHVVEKITGVKAEKISEAARMFATAGRGVVIWGVGATQHAYGTDVATALSNLALICGYIGREGTGIYPLSGQNNVQGACDMGALPDFLPGYIRVTDNNGRGRIAKLWGVESLPAEPGLTLIELLKASSRGRIKALYIVGKNLVVSSPDTHMAKDALRRLEFLVVQDIFLTETAELADIVLPAAAWAEKEGSYTSSERRVQWSFKACDPPGEAKPDWQIITMIARGIGLGAYFQYSSVEDITWEITKAVPQYRGITPGRLKENLSGIYWPCPSENHPGTKRLYEKEFPTNNGRATLIPVKYRPPAEAPDEEYPFILLTVRIVGQYHTMAVTKYSQSLMKRWGEPYVEINTNDAIRLGIKNEDYVLVETRRGMIKAKAKVTSKIPSGVVAVPIHWGVNVLTSAILDPHSKTPGLKTCTCKIRKA